MSVVFDVSALIPLLVTEDTSQAARVAFRAAQRRVAPDFVLIEGANVLWKKSLRGEVPLDHIPKMLGDLTRTLDELVPTMGLLARANRIAGELRHPVYDCIYLALAERLGGELVTGDGPFVDATRGTAWAGLLRRL